MRGVRARRLGMLSDLVREQRSLVLSCVGDQCTAPDREMDLKALLERHGDMELQRFAELCTCSSCGAREPRTICAPIGVPMSAAWKATR